MYINEADKTLIKDSTLIDTEKLLTINQIGAKTNPATNVENTNNVLRLLPDLSTPLTINLSI